MNQIIATLGFYWSGLEGIIFAVTALFSIYIFFKDPLRRWRFFGYRPTAIIALFDPNKKSILMIKHKDSPLEWGFVQGGIYSNNIIESIEHILARELKLSHIFFRIIGVKSMGSIDIIDNYRLKRIAQELIGNISITNKLKGKGYMACYTQANLYKLKLNKGYHIEDVKVFSLKNARSILEKSKATNRKKVEIMLRMLDNVNTLIAEQR